MARAKPEPYSSYSYTPPSVGSDSGSDGERLASTPPPPLSLEKVEVAEVLHLGISHSFEDGTRRLAKALAALRARPPPQSSGIIRHEVVIPREADVIGWLRKQSKSDPVTQNQNQNHKYPVLYFSPKTSTLGEGLFLESEALEDFPEASGSEVGCLGWACDWRGPAGTPFTEQTYNRISRFLKADEDNIRAFGGIRFNPDQAPSREWEPFGSYNFLIPTFEVITTPSHSTLACTIAWDNSLDQRAEGERIHDLETAVSVAQSVVAAVRATKIGTRNAVDLRVSAARQDPDEGEWDGQVTSVLDQLDTKFPEKISKGNGHLDSEEMRKLVLARRSGVVCDREVEALHLLSCLQDQDRKGYQFCMLLEDQSAFFGSTPERLYARKGSRVISEAVAATRRASSDSSVMKDLLTSEKDHNEFIVVRDAVKQALESLCPKVEIEVEKEVLNHVNVQHLYGRLSGKVAQDKNDYHLLSALHPTPAVAGYPCKESVEALSSIEAFDRGFYSGPFGWMSGSSSEFAVAIRSALARKKGPGSELMMYAGVGIVEGSKPDLEWKELDLKVQQFTQIINQRPKPLETFPNTNALVAFLVVEELCRLGVKYFCIAPGSRSTPLVLAAANHPRAEVVTCIDERSLGFFALGLAKGSGVPAAVITTSGTAVANLLPSVVEASEASVPLLVLTADRPPELHFTGANQTIDQSRIFGTYPRWFRNFPAYTPDMPLRMILGNLGTAWRHANLGLPGPVHLNFEFREPLAPTEEDWDREAVLDAKMRVWEISKFPYTRSTALAGQVAHLGPFEDLMAMISKCKKGLFVIGTSTRIEENLAILETAQMLGWPIIVDVSSGLKLGANGTNLQAHLVHNLDLILLDEEAGSSLQPECIIQIGRDPVSKRISNFISASCCEGGADLVMVGTDLRQRSPAQVTSHQLVLEPSALNDMVRSWLREHPENDLDACSAYRKFVRDLDAIALAAVSSCFEEDGQAAPMTEPLIARLVSEMLPASNALFLGNSTPIRDLEMFCVQARAESGFGPIAVSSNRGASGIDGVISTAAGFAESLGSSVTLVVGDVSFVHDSNALNLLSGPQSSRRSPLTTIVINNSGGRIFEMLPVAQTIDNAVLESCFVTNPDANISSLCRAYRVPYQFASNEADTVRALQKAWGSKVHNVIEIFVDPTASADFRSFIKERVNREVSRFTARQVLLASDAWDTSGAYAQIETFACTRTSYPLTREVTTSSTALVKEMLAFSVKFSHQPSGKARVCHGEVSPLPGLHTESFAEAESQLMCLATMVSGKGVPLSAASMDGAMESWFRMIGARPDTLLPSVRFGIESALIESLSSILGQSVWQSGMGAQASRDCSSALVHLVGLVSAKEGPDFVSSCVKDAEALALRGYRGLKLKVGRSSVDKDVEMVRAVRKALGPAFVLRCDANRNWSLAEALAFAEGVEGCGIEFIEEPVGNLEDLRNFCAATEGHLRVALDEHLSEHLRDAAVGEVGQKAKDLIEEFSPALDAAVLKPSILGSLEKAKAVVDVCCELGVKPIVSATFESSIGLRTLAEFAWYASTKHAEAKAIASGGGSERARGLPLLHGLGTIDWNSEEPSEGKLTLEEGPLAVAPGAESVRSLAVNVGKFPRMGKDGRAALVSLDHQQTIHKDFLKLYKFNTSLGQGEGEGAGSPVVFVHGFLGDVDDWVPLMSSASIGGTECYGISLPGHSTCTFENAKHTAPAFQNTFAFTSESMAALVEEAGVERPVLVAYSMGARLALDMVVSHPDKFSGLVIISSSPGIREEKERESRAIKDLLLSAQIREAEDGLESFLNLWYRQPLFGKFADSPQFPAILAKRAGSHTAHGLADALSGLSPGLQDPLWSDLKSLRVPLAVVCGDLDDKYLSLSQEMCGLARQSPFLCEEEDVEVHVVQGVGHCVHIEAPQVVAPILTQFLRRANQRAKCNDTFLKAHSQE